MSKLSTQQQLFAHEYMRLKGNATEAAKAAGYSARSARNQGARLMANDDIRSLVAGLEERRLEKVDASAERVLRELALLAMARISRVLRPDGSAKPLKEWGEAELAAVTELEVDGGVVRAKMRDKRSALDTLARHHGLLRDVVEVKREFDLDLVSDDEWESLTALQHVVRAKVDG